MLRLLLVALLLVVVIVTIAAVPSLISDHIIDTNSNTNDGDTVDRELAYIDRHEREYPRKHYIKRILTHTPSRSPTRRRKRTRTPNRSPNVKPKPSALPTLVPSQSPTTAPKKYVRIQRTSVGPLYLIEVALFYNNTQVPLSG